ncbi:MAG TPA: hypothetical protein VNA20_13545 [Frankiaceae bacterium]|nr:hypothetical protein [Frankiaceae bacterium]
MRFRLLSVIALAAAAAFPGLAHAGTAPEGNPCAFLTVNQSELTGPTTWTGHIRGGPVAAPGAAAVTLTCSIHVGNATHAGPAAVVESAAGPGIAVLEPRVVSYQAEEWDLVATCTAATVDGVTWYRAGNGWSPDPSTPCVVTQTINPLHPPIPDLPPPLDPVENYLRCYFSGVTIDCGPYLWQGLDGTLCPALIAARPSLTGVVDIREDGDLYVNGEFWWDCPPYTYWG